MGGMSHWAIRQTDRNIWSHRLKNVLHSQWGSSALYSKSPVTAVTAFKDHRDWKKWKRSCNRTEEEKYGKMVNTQKMVSFLYIFGAFGGGSELAGITRRHLMLEDPTKPPSAGLTPC